MSENKSAGNPEIEKAYIHDIFNGHPPEYIGDAIEIAKHTHDLYIPATLEQAYSQDIDEFEGKFLVLEQQERFDHWMQGYSEEAQHFIQTHIEDQSREFVYENAKIGLVSHSNNALTIKPINHLVTVACNRRLGIDRALRDDTSDAHKLWQHAFSHAVRNGIENISFAYPSQLFVEFGLVTSDNFVPIAQKETVTSVYAHRNQQRPLKTCGLETGINWRDGIVETDGMSAKLDIISSIVAGLKRRYPMPDWNDKIDQLEVKVVSYALQTLHLNTAIVGYCKIPYTKDELHAQLKDQSCGGLDHSALEFISFDQCKTYLEQDAQSIEWHGTAMMRLKIIVDALA